MVFISPQSNPHWNAISDKSRFSLSMRFSSLGIALLSVHGVFELSKLGVYRHGFHRVTIPLAFSNCSIFSLANADGEFPFFFSHLATVIQETPNFRASPSWLTPNLIRRFLILVLHLDFMRAMVTNVRTLCQALFIASSIAFTRICPICPLKFASSNACRAQAEQTNMLITSDMTRWVSGFSCQHRGHIISIFLT